MAEQRRENTGVYQKVGGPARTDYMTPRGNGIKKSVYKARLSSL